MSGPEVGEARVRANRRLGPELWELVLEGLDAAAYRPAQFLVIRAWSGLDPLLGRPFSIADRPAPEVLTIAHRVVGPATAILADLEPGDRVTVHGPLGRGFTVDEARVLAVAGGIGIAPFPLLARRIAEEGGTLVLAYGARSAPELVLADRIEATGARVLRVSEAGDLPRSGLVTEAMLEVLEEGGVDRIAACGPEPMLEAVVREAARRDLPCEVSLERIMACGFGVCYSCVVRCRGPRGEPPASRRTCLDGPVLAASRLAGLPWTTE